ncbi:DUF1275 family protein [Nocardia sp. NPDC004278]
MTRATISTGSRVAGNPFGRGPARFVCSVIQSALALLAPPSAHVGQPYSGWSLAVLIAFLGAGLGLQNATARALAVPDLTTTVLTLTLTGIAADSVAVGSTNSKLGRRLIPIGAMFAGAAIGSALVVHGHGPAALAVAVFLLAAIVVFGRFAARSARSWTAKS